MAKEVMVDEGECTGCELCVDMLPEVFRMNNRGVSEAQNPHGTEEGTLQNVIDNCPAECIHWK